MKRSRRYKFRHRWSLTIVLVILLPLGLALGTWQLGRAEQKRAELQQRQQTGAKTSDSLGSTDTDLAVMLYRNVKVHGTFDMERQLLLDNQKYRGVPGYHVFTPMRLQGSDTRVLVSRGWIRQGDDRRFIPALPGPSAKVVVQGRVEKVPSIGIKVGQPGESGRTWPKRVTYMDLDWIETQTGFDLLPYVVYQTEGAEFGLIRDWRERFQPRQGMTPEKHMGYAVQWYMLAALVLIMYVVLSFKKIGNDTGSGDIRGE